MGTNPLSPNGVSTADIQQHLTLGREPNAELSLTRTSWEGENAKNWNSVPSLEWIEHSKNWTPGNDSITALKVNFKPGTSVSPTNDIKSEWETQTFRVTFSNLQNSSYQSADGTIHKIAKIERTFSTFKAGDTNLYYAGEYIMVNSDPTDGFWYEGMTDVAYYDKYFDDKGNQITFDKGAYIAVTSLNKDPNRTEGVAVENGTVYALKGSAITVHGKVLYSDTDTDTKGKFEQKDWDRADSPTQYYGAGLVQLTGNVAKLKFFTNFEDSFNGKYGGTWATVSTIIPASEFNLKRPTPPTPPEKNPQPTTKINYHYNVTKALPFYIPHQRVQREFTSEKMQ